MTIEDKIKESMARMIERKEGIENVVVSSWEEEFDVESYGGCETCGPEYEKSYSVDIWYTHSGVGSAQRTYYHFSGSFGELIKELDSDD